MKKLSLSEVANLLGVSKTLVSFVINGKAEEKGISKATAERVLRKIKELDYHPNNFARILRTGKSKTIGVVVADISNPFYATICRFIEKHVEPQGYNIVIGSTDESPEKERNIIRLMAERGVDGLIVSPTRPYSEDVEEEFLNLRVPVIFIDRHYPKSKINHVIASNFDVAYKATKHLIENGHKNIGFIAIKPTESSVMIDRFNGYKKALSDSKIKFQKKYYSKLELNDLHGSIYEKLECLNLIENAATALITSNNKITLAVLECFKRRNIKIPDDISLVSFDYLDVFKILTPSISSIQLFAEDIGDLSAKMMMKKLNPKSKRVKNIVVEAKFHPRESVRNINI